MAMHDKYNKTRAPVRNYALIVLPSRQYEDASWKSGSLVALLQPACRWMPRINKASVMSSKSSDDGVVNVMPAWKPMKGCSVYKDGELGLWRFHANCSALVYSQCAI